MAKTPQPGPGPIKRAWHRQSCGADGLVVTDGFKGRIVIVDASRGGFKLRFEDVETVGGFFDAPPKDITVTDSGGVIHPAVVLWVKPGLAGCRFYHHIALDDVVRLMAGKFSLRLGGTRQPPGRSP